MKVTKFFVIDLSKQILAFHEKTPFSQFQRLKTISTNLKTSIVANMALSTHQDVVIPMPVVSTASFDTMTRKSNTAIYLSLIAILGAILISILIFTIILASVDNIGDEFVWSLWLELCALFTFITSVLGCVWYTFKSSRNIQSTESEHEMCLGYIVQLLAIVIILAMFTIMAYIATLYDRNDVFYVWVLFYVLLCIKIYKYTKSGYTLKE